MWHEMIMESISPLTSQIYAVLPGLLNPLVSVHKVVTSHADTYFKCELHGFLLHVYPEFDQ